MEKFAKSRFHESFPKKIMNFKTTMWKFENFPAIQILRETNFRASRNSKTAIFAILKILNLDFW